MSSTIINPKPCNYGCNTRIYWNISENAYFEVFAKKKHVCPNRTKSPNSNGNSVNRPYYSKKPLDQKQKMSNSLELLTGPITEIQKKYEILSDIVIEYNGKVHGSQSHIIATTNVISLVVYFEVPEGKREEVKQKFNNIIRNNQVILKKLI